MGLGIPHRCGRDKVLPKNAILNTFHVSRDNGQVLTSGK